MPKGNRHYSNCIEHKDTLYISGQLPINPQDKSIPDGIENQTKLVLSKIDQILLATESHKSKVIQVRIYLSDINNWDIVNKLYADYFEEHKPARCVVPVPELHFGVLLEVELIAAK